MSSSPSSAASEDEAGSSPRWTLPARREISPENLHISSFVIASKSPDEPEGRRSILLLKAGETHPLSFRRGLLLIPAAVLRYGEKPREAARRALGDQFTEPRLFRDPEYRAMQSYLGAHWDIVFLFSTSLADAKNASLVPKPPYIEAAFYELANLPRDKVAEDHLEVLDAMIKSPKGD